jgi:asparaginyl-tRNA synthetase
MTKTIKQTLQSASVGDTVIVKGWIRTTKSMQNVYFININDGSMLEPTQVVVNAESNLTNEDKVKKLTTGCSVSIKGVLIESNGKGQDLEIHAQEIDILGNVEDPATYPMPMKRHTNEHLRENAHLRARTNIGGAVSRVRNATHKALQDFFEKEGFLWCSTPLITSSDCEGAGEMFKVSTLDFENIPFTDEGKVDYTQDFFGQQTGLTVSGQLNAETYACALTKVYTFGPTFRAENSHTSRHLSEFWMVEPEVAFADMNDAISLSERMLKSVISQVMERCPEDIKFFNQRVDKTCLQRLTDFVSKYFVICDYTDAIKILIDSGEKFETQVEWGIDLGSEHERYLAEQHFKSPLALTNYPKDIKSFYMRQNEDGKTVAAFDVLAPGIGEIIGGSQREERLDVLLERMEEVNLNPEDYQCS